MECSLSQKSFSIIWYESATEERGERSWRKAEEKWKRGQVVTSYPLLSFHPNPHQLGSTMERIDRKGSMMRRGGERR